MCEHAQKYMLYAINTERNRLVRTFVSKARKSFSTLNSIACATAELEVSSFAPFLRWCAREKALTAGKHVHHYLIRSGLERDIFLGNLVLQMYFSCGALDEAFALSARMDQKNEFTWRIEIVSLVHHGHFQKAFHLFQQMLSKGFIPDRLTFISIITGCCSYGRTVLERANIIHYVIMIVKLDADVVVSNALIAMYGKDDSLEDARSTFDIMPSHDVISWNGMIMAYANKGHSNDAIDLFKKMDLAPDNFTFIAVLSAIDSPSAIEFGIHVHDLIRASKYRSDVTVNNAVINMYGRCESLKGAEDTIHDMQVRNTISWTTMLTVTTEYGDGGQAFQVYKQMLHEALVPSIVTFVAFINLCTKKGALAEGKQAHACIIGGHLNCGVVLETALVNMYGKFGNVRMAHSIFEDMSQRNVISWGTIISINAQHAPFRKAIQLLQQMQQEGQLPDRVIHVSILDVCTSQAGLIEGQRFHACLIASRISLDVYLGSALVRLYGECGQLRDAEEIFNSMVERNVFTWNVMGAGFLQLEEDDLALACFQQMQQEAVFPDDVTFVNMFSACGICMKLSIGKMMHVLFGMSDCLSNTILWNALVSMYGRCSSLRDAKRVFEEMPKCNVVSWNAIMAAFAQNGYMNESLAYFTLMKEKGFMAESSTFSLVLSACSHGGLIEEAFHTFGFMIHVSGIKAHVDHYNCMLDLLARAGRLDEAEILLKGMPSKFNFISLMTLLAACRFQSDINRGEHIAARACHLDPSNVTPLVMLSNIYAMVGCYELTGNSLINFEGT
ncbi:hypothetical protein KP509_14G077900 [Ceratopteris richardii]|uniref:Pentatricopeptide repeat-containing protein n=1 Tax=Ceratopteris richardii TaxID=49495 RepID=A0A8T2TBF5_CERRI|nr:hypothetical protein KP509_14G077900 [Ceratopteris richardii]